MGCLKGRALKIILQTEGGLYQRTMRLVGWRGLYRACYKVFRTKGGEREGLRWFGEHRKVEG